MWRIVRFAVFCGFVWGQSEFVPTNYEEVTKPTGGGFGAEDRCGEGARQFHKCVPYHRCDPDTNTIKPDTDGMTDNNNQNNPEPDYSLLIDIRLGESNPCTEFLHVCCKTADNSQPTSPEPITPSPTPIPTPDGDDSTPMPSRQDRCGIRNVNGIDFKITGNTHNEAEYGEFPWMVAILKANYDPSVDPALAICGGSLIAPRVILTGAHCVHKFSASDLRVRAGEWDTQTTNERYPYQELDVAQVIVHEEFKDGVLLNDVALLVLNKPFKKARHIGTICLPNQNDVVISNECYATGWGKTQFGKEGAYQVILKKIDLPIVPHKKCEAALRKTRLGSYFNLHSSFTCAGGVEGKDTCTGDGGSPLVCPAASDPTRYVQAGIVAWGIGCGTSTPGVYADVSKFRNWVDENMKRLNLGSKTYSI